jgi:hypothetical protein
VKNEEVLHRVKEERKGISYIERKEGRLTGLVASWHRNCFLKPVTEGKIEGRI